MIALRFTLNERVRLPDRREGLAKAVIWGGCPPGGKPPPDAVTVLTDDYYQVECWSWQLTKIQRTRGRTVKSKDPAGSFYQVELDNVNKLHMAVWHAHWDTYGVSGSQEQNIQCDEQRGILSNYSRYLKEYRRGDKAPLPVKEDIRAQSPGPIQEPKQLSMF
mgnify:CR=1 FL=1